MMDLPFFAEMAWKSALIAGATLLLAYALRSRSAADRALVLRIGVGMLLLLPPIMLWFPGLEVVAFAAPEAPLALVLDPAAALHLATLPAAPEPTIWDDPTPLVVLAYLGGLAMVGSRLAAGLWTLRRWTREARPVTRPEWIAAFDRVRWSARHPERIRLMASVHVVSPLSWGWRRPVILLDPDTLDLPEDAEAILAHEVAHIARADWPVLMLARLTSTLFWFNPLVWMLEREVVQQAEEAADCAAAERVEPARYAETLLSWAQANTLVPANSIAPTARALGRRVRTVLDRRLRERPSGSAWTALAIILCLGVAAPVAAMRLVAAAPQPPEPPHAPSVRPAPTTPVVPAPPSQPVAPRQPEHIVVTIPPIPDVPATVDAALAPVPPRIPTIVAEAMTSVDRELMEEALREMRRNPPPTREAIAEALREARAIRVEVPASLELAMRDARRAARVAPAAVAASMAHGAEGMMQGAAGMEEGARSMEREATRLEDRDYRERVIARESARGKQVTHEDLLEASRGLREGARGLRQGAEEMRQAGRRMRDGRR